MGRRTGLLAAGCACALLTQAVNADDASSANLAPSNAADFDAIKAKLTNTGEAK